MENNNRCDLAIFPNVVREFKVENLCMVFENYGKSRIQHCGQPVVPDRSVFIGQKLLENAKF